MSILFDYVDFSYKRRVPIFEGTTFSLLEGSTAALLGPNGTGKTTLLKLLCGLLIPRKGRVEIDGETISRRTKEGFAKFIYVPDTLQLPPISARKFGQITAPFYERFNFGEYLELLDKLTVNPDTKMSSLSFGQQKKAWLAFAFAAGTKYLIMDEPSNGLDPASMETLRKLIAAYSDGQKTILISTHHIREVEHLCNECIFISNEHKLMQYSVPKILEQFTFGVAAEPPANTLFSEAGFAQAEYLAPREAGTPESPLNLMLFYKALAAGKINARNS